MGTEIRRVIGPAGLAILLAGVLWGQPSEPAATQPARASGSAEGSASPWDAPASVAFARHATISTARLLADRWAYRDLIHWEVQFPKGEQVRAAVGRVEFARPGLASLVLEADARLEALVFGREERAFRLRGTARLPAELDDGAGVLSVWLTGGKHAASGELDGLQFELRVVRGLFDRVAEPHRAELAACLDEANRHHPIWGRMPTWPNLQHALEAGAAMQVHATSADGGAASSPAGPAAGGLPSRVRGFGLPADTGSKPRPADPWTGLRGFVLRAYQSRQLGRMVPYTVYVPWALDLSEPAPLLILLHGSGGDFRNLIADHHAGQRFEEHPMLIANAGAYLHQEYRHMARLDVLAIIEDMAAKYRIDPSRIYCQGISLGGRGCLELAGLHPGLFAAVSAQGVYGIQEELLDPFWSVHPEQSTGQTFNPTGRGFAWRADVRSLVPHLKGTAIELVYGHRDENTPPGTAGVLEAVGRRHGVKMKLRGFETDHNISLPAYDWATTRAWMLEHQREAAAAGTGKVAPADEGWEGRAMWPVFADRFVLAYCPTEAGRADVAAALRSIPLSLIPDFEPRIGVVGLEESRAEAFAGANIVLFLTHESPLLRPDGLVGRRLRALMPPADPLSELAPPSLWDAEAARLILLPHPFEAGRHMLVVSFPRDLPVQFGEFFWDRGLHTGWACFAREPSLRRGQPSVLKMVSAGDLTADFSALGPSIRGDYRTREWLGPKARGD